MSITPAMIHKLRAALDSSAWTEAEAKALLLAATSHDALVEGLNYALRFLMPLDHDTQWLDRILKNAEANEQTKRTGKVLPCRPAEGDQGDCRASKPILQEVHCSGSSGTSGMVRGGIQMSKPTAGAMRAARAVSGCTRANEVNLKLASIIDDTSGLKELLSAAKHLWAQCSAPTTAAEYDAGMAIEAAIKNCEEP